MHSSSAFSWPNPTARRSLVTEEGFFSHYYPSIQSPVVCLFPYLFSWSFSFDVTEADYFYSFCNYDKNRAAPSLRILIQWLRDDEGTTSSHTRYNCVSAHVRTHAFASPYHQVAHSANPHPRDHPAEFSHDAVERHSVWLTSEQGTHRGLVGRCDASWHVAESVILRGRPGTQKGEKNQAAMYLILCSFASFQFGSIWPWFLWLRLLVDNVATSLGNRSVPELLCDH